MKMVQNNTPNVIEQDILNKLFDKNSDRFLNREISWLLFDQRVLSLAKDKNTLLLERLKYLSIAAKNLDEFFMTRFAGIKSQIENDENRKTDSNLSPQAQLTLIRPHICQIILNEQNCWIEIKRLLEKESIYILKPAELNDDQKIWLQHYFEHNIFPALTPLAIDPAHPFPQLPNLGLALIMATNRGNREAKMIMPIPTIMPRFIKLPSLDNTYNYITLEDTIISFKDFIFADMEFTEYALIALIRNGDLEVSDEAEDLVGNFEQALKQRRKADAVCIKVSSSLRPNMRQFLTSKLEIAESDIFEENELMGLGDIKALYDIDRLDLKYPIYKPRYPERIKEFHGDCFAAINHKDIVIHHPYETFDVVVDFLQQAARDKDVIAIKQTLYRTSEDSEIVKALVEAAENGKAVTVVVELKARFDEEANLRWARNLEMAGAQVVFGLAGYKTHSKMSLVVKKTNGEMKSYAHIGTGNYNPQTAKLYVDLSFFTCDEEICQDIAHAFNYLTGYMTPGHFNNISMSPINLRQKLIELIEKEIEIAKNTNLGSIWIKVNSLVDNEIIDYLYKASQNGVKITLIVRGICTLRPRIKGLSENIEVKSIVGRFLEHSRIFCFGNGSLLPGKNTRVFISSADLMHRNLNRRVEIMLEIKNPTVHEQILQQIMLALIKDNLNSYIMDKDGNFSKMTIIGQSFSAHEYFMNNPSLSGRGKSLKISMIPRLNIN